MMAVLAYPLALGLKPAVADPAPQPQGGADLAQAGAFGLQLAGDETALAQTQGQLDAVASQLRRQAVNAYVDGGSANAQPQSGAGYQTVLRSEYLSTVTSNEQSSLRRLDRARSALRAEQARLQSDEQLATAAEAGAGNTQGAIATSANPDPSATSFAINGPQDFAVALLRTLGDPVTSQNTQAIVAWCQREGGGWGNVAQFNPLNTSMRMPGSHAINGDGVQSYTSWSEGLTATVATLNGASYRRILAALSAGSSVQAVENAVASSPWGTHF